MMISKKSLIAWRIILALICGSITFLPIALGMVRIFSAAGTAPLAVVSAAAADEGDSGRIHWIYMLISALLFILAETVRQRKRWQEVPKSRQTIPGFRKGDQ
ncbi:MAG: hypothetical protein LBO80_05340 [Treponema sp.]|nr:hypothetical protein [Treponema sp.]